MFYIQFSNKIVRKLVIFKRFQLFLLNWPLQYPQNKLLLKLPAIEGICWNIENYGLASQSPDLNPIEQIWGNKLDRSIVHSKESHWLVLQKAWNKICVEVLRKYTDSMPQRCAAVIAAKGGHTKYYKTVRLTSSDICCALSNHLHVSWTLWNEIMFWRQFFFDIFRFVRFLTLLPTIVIAKTF